MEECVVKLYDMTLTLKRMTETTRMIPDSPSALCDTSPTDQFEPPGARVNLALPPDTSHPLGSLDEGTVGSLAHGGATATRLKVGGSIDTFVIIVSVSRDSFDRTSGGSRGTKCVSYIRLEAKVLGGFVSQLDLSGSVCRNFILLDGPLSSRSGGRVHTGSHGIQSRSGFAALARHSNFIGANRAADGVAGCMARSATYTFTLSSNLVGRTSFRARGITSPSDPVVVLASGACGAFRSIVDLTSGGTGASTVFTDKVGFTAYAIGVLLSGLGAFRDAFGVVGVGLLGRVVALTFLVHLERVGRAADGVFESTSSSAVVFAFSVIARSLDCLVLVVTLDCIRT
jgi:hypothetical protein